MRVNFVVYSRGAPQGSKTYLGQGRFKESCERVSSFRADVREAALDSIPSDWDLSQTVRVHYRFHFRRPQSHLTSKGNLTKSAPLHPTSRMVGDIEKLARATSDALSSIAFHDDSQVIEMKLSKCYDDRDLTIITIETIG